MKPAWVQKLEDLCAKATPGPWEPCLGSGVVECTAIHFEGNSDHPYGLFVCDLVPDYALDPQYKDALEFKHNNMEFIAASRSALPKILAVNAKMAEALRLVRKELKDADTQDEAIVFEIIYRALSAYESGEVDE